MGIRVTAKKLRDKAQAEACRYIPKVPQRYSIRIQPQTSVVVKYKFPCHFTLNPIIVETAVIGLGIEMSRVL